MWREVLNMVRIQKPSRRQWTNQFKAVDNFHIGIVGAGIGGVATAIALRRVGAEVTVLEAAEELGEVFSSLLPTSFPPSQWQGLLLADSFGCRSVQAFK